MRLPQSKLAQAAMGWGTLLLFWIVVTELRIVDPLIVASPVETAKALVLGFSDGELGFAMFATAYRTLGAFFLAAGLGIPLGVLLGTVPIAKGILGGPIDAFRSIPSIALLPVFLLVFGIGDLSKIAVAAFVCMWTIAIYTAHGISTGSRIRRFLLRLHQVTWWQYICDGYVYPALPSVIGGMRVSLSLALVVMVATEMILGSTIGLGQSLFEAQVTYRVPLMYAAVVLSAMMGIGLNRLLLSITRKLVSWQPIEQI